MLRALRMCILSDEGNAAAKLALLSFRQQVRAKVGHAYIDKWTGDSLERPCVCAFIARLFITGWMPFAAVRSVLTERITPTSDSAEVACVLQVFRVLPPSPQDPDARVRSRTAPHQKELQRLFLALLHCPAAVKLDPHNAAVATPYRFRGCRYFRHQANCRCCQCRVGVFAGGVASRDATAVGQTLIFTSLRCPTSSLVVSAEAKALR